MVKFTGDVADLEAIGFQALSLRRHPSAEWSIAAGPIAVDALEALDRIDHVLKVEGSRPMRPDLDRSVPEIKADRVHGGDPPLKGAGVVVGVIDGGFDWRHPNFLKPDGTTRVLGIWDQKLSPRPGETSPRFGTGVEYTKQQIDAALAGTGTVRTRDRTGHGTQVAGIAVGDGSQSGNCHGDFTFVGVAPEADIIFVVIDDETAAFGESVNLVHALDFIWEHPGIGGRPVVINLSQGDNLGAHDGTALVEQMIDLDVVFHPRHVVVKSAGNEADDNHHAQLTIGANDFADLSFTVESGDDVSEYLELWYDGEARLRISLSAPTVPDPSREVDPDDAEDWTVDPGLPEDSRTVVHISSNTDDADNHDNWVHIEFEPEVDAEIPSGPWELHLENLTATAATVDAWIDRKGPTFEEADATEEGTINVPGTTDSVITVGAYSQSGFLVFNWTGDIAAFSGRGPTRDGRIKPDIAAPGVRITSTKANIRPNCCCDCCRDFYVEKDGTSYAAPHVTGVVALMLQRNPNLTFAEVKKHLMDTARVPDNVDPDSLPDDTWGAGKLDAEAAVDDVPAPIGPDPHDEAPEDGGEDNRDVAAARQDSRKPGAGGGPALLAALHRCVLSVPSGEEWAAIVSRHFSEVRGLINHNRRVAMRWHRMQGPALLARLAHLAAGSPKGAVLPALDLTALPERLDGFLAALHRYGSPSLRDTLSRHRAELSGLDLQLLSLLRPNDEPPAKTAA